MNSPQELGSLGEAARENFSFSRRVTRFLKKAGFCDIARESDRSYHLHRKSLFQQGTGEESTALLFSAQGIFTSLSSARLWVLIRCVAVTQE